MTYKSRSLSSVSIIALVSNIVIAAPLMAQTVHITAPQTAPNDAALDTQVITGPITEYSGQLQVTVIGSRASGADATAEINIRGIKDDIEQNNSGEINIQVTGGVADSSANAGTGATAAITIDGIEGTIENDNVGSIAVKGVSKSAITSGGGHASVKVNVKAVDDRILGDNLGHLSSYAEAGEAIAQGSGNANASVEGFGTYLDVEGDNVGTIKAEGYAGTATSKTGIAYADADITGIDNDLEGENKGLIDIVAKGGDARTEGSERATSYALAIGVKGYTERNSGSILVDADNRDATAASTNGEANAAADVYGVHGNLLVENSGQISVISSAGSSETSGVSTANSKTLAVGVNGYIQNNSGHVLVDADGRDAKALSAGGNADASAEAYGTRSDLNDDNSGEIKASAHAGKAIGFKAEANAVAKGVDNTLKGDNMGIIHAEAFAGQATSTGTTGDGAFASAEVVGVDDYIEGNNSGDIVVFGQGGKATANGTGSANASVESIGVYNGIRNSDPNVTTDNLGMVAAYGTGGTASSVGGNAYGYADVTGLDGSLGGENKGLIKAIAIGKSAITQSDQIANAEGLAIGVKGDADANSGTILVQATGGTAQSANAVKANGSANAFGIGYVDGSTRYGVEGAFTNTGFIKVEATAGTANSVQDKAIAYGVVLNGATTLNNSGLIVASATGGAGAEAYQVHAGSNALTVNSYGILFNDDLTENFSGTIQADNPNNVAFNSATLHVHHSNSTKVNEAYEIPDLVAGQDVQQFAHLDTSGVVGHGWSVEAVESSWGTTNQEVIFRFAPDVSSPQLVAQQQYGVIDATQRIGAGLLTDLMFEAENAGGEGLLLSYEGTPVSDAEKAVADMAGQSNTSGSYGVFYAAPLHLSQQNQNDSLGYSASTTGVVTGYNRVISSDLIVGANVFYGHSALDFDGVYDQAKETVDTYGVGVQGAYRKDAMLFTGQSTFYHTNNTYKDSSAQAKETYDSQNLLTRVAASYIWEHGNNIFSPEFGLSHLWHSRGAFSVDNQGVPDVRYDAISNHQFSVDASFGWTGTYQVQDGELKANLRAGLRQILGDGGFKDVLRSGANGVATVRSDQDQTLARASASLDYTKGNFGASIGVLGEYGEDTRDTAFFGHVSYKF
ncbi:autotransporter outer membrane beta-barrel domain-containing protein [Pseudovibrio sp. Ad26]|uniref:autotransporter family protein n=1 Tax=Pseudovibrio sp. Ad26 TaxID=989410 RepID=UPI0007B207F1|nr:autotransporter outer membrane beta-barrel domain-containing protein [Pseudovibrio sp. Ad26]KZL13159.1 Autotransporter beta-domain protein [Pseudovibrio sp. Ad26]